MKVTIDNRTTITEYDDAIGAWRPALAEQAAGPVTKEWKQAAELSFLALANLYEGRARVWEGLLDAAVANPAVAADLAAAAGRCAAHDRVSAREYRAHAERVRKTRK